MLIFLTALAALAQPDGTATEGCAAVSLEDLVRSPPPSILVLGENPGEVDDLRRAAKVVRALRDRGPVTIALQAIHSDEARNLEGLMAPEPALDRVADAVAWAEHWPHAIDGYRPLLALGLSDSPGGVHLVPIGTDPAPNASTNVPIVPNGYAERLAVLAGDTLAPTMRTRIAQARTWSDQIMAESALAAWDGKGYLVVLADRTRVAGPGGIDWQLAQKSEESQLSVILDWSEQDCVDGTLQWHASTLRASIPSFMAPKRAAEATVETRSP